MFAPDSRFEEWASNVEHVIQSGCKDLIVYADGSGKASDTKYTPGKLGCCQHVELCYISELIGVNPEQVKMAETGSREKVKSENGKQMVSARKICGKNGMSIIWKDLGLGSKGDFLKAGGAIVH